MRPFFQLPFLDEQRKLEKFLKGFNRFKPDVMFFQEYSDALHRHFIKEGNYYVAADPTKDTMIVALPEGLPEAPPQRPGTVGDEQPTEEQAEPIGAVGVHVRG